MWNIVITKATYVKSWTNENLIKRYKEIREEIEARKRSSFLDLLKKIETPELLKFLNEKFFKLVFTSYEFFKGNILYCSGRKMLDCFGMTINPSTLRIQFFTGIYEDSISCSEKEISFLKDYMISTINVEASLRIVIRKHKLYRRKTLQYEPSNEPILINFYFYLLLKQLALEKDGICDVLLLFF